MPTHSLMEKSTVVNSNNINKTNVLNEKVHIKQKRSLTFSKVALLLYVSYNVVFIVGLCKDCPCDCYNACPMAPSKLHSSKCAIVKDTWRSAVRKYKRWLYPTTLPTPKWPIMCLLGR